MPDTWPSVLQEMTSRAEAAFASFVAFDDTVLRWTGTPAAIALIEAYKSVEHIMPNVRIPASIGLKHAGFLTDHDMLPEDVIRDHPFYREFMRARGYGWVAGSVIEVPTGEKLVFGVERSYSRGPFEKRYVADLDLLRPHLARAALISARLHLERARAMADALGVLSIPAAVLRWRGHIIAANDAFEKLIPSVFRDHRRRLVITEPSADVLLGAALSQPRDRIARSFPIAAGEDRPPMIVHLLPVCGAASDVFPALALVIAITPIVPSLVPSAEILQGLFDLTPAEARIAREIGKGRSAEDIATSTGAAYETVRAHIKATLRKTGLHRQVQLASLLAGIRIPLQRG